MNAAGVVRALNKVGENVTLRRVTGTARIPFDCPARALVSVGQAVLLVGGVQQTGDRIMLTGREMAERRWPAPPRHGDQVIYADGTVTIVQGRSDASILGPDTVYVFHTIGAGR